MHSNGILQNEKFIISLPQEKKNLLSEKNLKIIENQLRDFFSIRDLKIKKSDSYKKIVSELKPEIKKFDNSE